MKKLKEKTLKIYEGMGHERPCAPLFRACVSEESGRRENIWKEKKEKERMKWIFSTACDERR